MFTNIKGFKKEFPDYFEIPAEKIMTLCRFSAHNVHSLKQISLHLSHHSRIRL